MPRVSPAATALRCPRLSLASFSLLGKLSSGATRAPRRAQQALGELRHLLSFSLLPLGGCCPPPPPPPAGLSRSIASSPASSSSLRRAAPPGRLAASPPAFFFSPPFLLPGCSSRPLGCPRLSSPFPGRGSPRAASARGSPEPPPDRCAEQSRGTGGGGTKKGDTPGRELASGGEEHGGRGLSVAAGRVVRGWGRELEMEGENSAPRDAGVTGGVLRQDLRGVDVLRV